MTLGSSIAVRSKHPRVNLLKTFFKWLLGLAVLLALLLGLALVSDFQTWAAQAMLARHPELHTTIGTLSVGFGEIEAEDVRVEIGNALVTLPTVTAKLPVIDCLRKRKISLRSFVAKDWTVELNHPEEPVAATTEPTAKPDDASDASTPSPTPTPEPTLEPTPPPPMSVHSAQQSLRAFPGFLTSWRLPFDFSADGVDLEGDLFVPSSGKQRTRVHIAAQGGGIGTGHDGNLSVTSSWTFLGAEIVDLTWHGDFLVAMNSPRTIARVAVKGALSAAGASSASPFNLETNFSVSRDTAAENYTLDLARDERPLVKLDLRFEPEKRRLAGTWAVNGHNGDLGPLVDDHLLPALAVEGAGKLAAENDFTQLSAAGDLRILGDIWKAWGLGWSAPRSVITTTHFNLTANENELKIDRWEFALAGPQPVVLAHFLQPVLVDLKTYAAQVKNPQENLIKLSLQRFPLEWLSGLTGGLSLGGTADGEFYVKASGPNLEAIPSSPLTAHQVFLRRNGQTLIQNFDFSVLLRADKTDRVWRLQASPATLSRDGHVLATIEANASQALTEAQPLEINGKWSSDLASLFASSATSIAEKKIPPLSGEFTASLGEETKIESTLNLPAPRAGASLRAKISAELGSDRAIAFHVPLELAIAKNMQALSLDGNWEQNELGDQISINVSAKNIDREHLQLLSEPLAWLRGISFGPRANVNTAGAPLLNDTGKLPFWGDLIGNITISFDHFGPASDQLEDVHGSFRFNRDSIRLMSGQYRRGSQFCAANGTVLFDPTAEIPYRLQASFDDGDVDATPLFGTPPADTDPVFHGHFAVATTVAGKGIDFEDLLHQSQEEIKLKSQGGICRLLKTDVGDAMPVQTEHQVGDAASTVGSLVEKVAGIDRKNGGHIRVGKITDAVLNFSYDVAEIGYSEIAITVTRKFESAWQVKEFSLLAPDEHITGTGEVNGTGGNSITSEPLQGDFKLGVRGKAAEQLNLAGLLSNEKDKLGYTLMKQSIHIGGTLQHLDLGVWHDLLADAAFRKTSNEK